MELSVWRWNIPLRRNLFDWEIEIYKGLKPEPKKRGLEHDLVLPDPAKEMVPGMGRSFDLSRVDKGFDKGLGTHPSAQVA
ncbi:hypothetical protein V6N12_046079 [Hibiscus sabdariffa]|uniref:Uncharacterized protein n=1 Tax=Hibiscus sabdariffa TaxID=183260 RepID=A0ABR2G525_9ROSI